jgi:hypothetical protein
MSEPRGEARSGAHDKQSGPASGAGPEGAVL